MNSADELTTLASWARAIRAALVQAEIDWQPLFDQAGIAPEALADPEARIPLSHTTRLWEAVVAATEDDAFGLRVARHVNQTTFHALTVTTLVSDTLLDAMERTVRYSRVVTDAAGTSVGGDATQCWMDLGHLPVDPHRHQIVHHVVARGHRRKDFTDPLRLFRGADGLVAEMRGLAHAGFDPLGVY